MSQQEIDSLALRRIAAGVEPGQAWSSYQAAARALDRIPAGAVPDRLRARVALLGSFTLEPFVPVLRVEAARAGIWLDIYVAPYGQYLSELIDPTSGLYRFRPKVTFLAVDPDVLWNQRWAESPPLKTEPVVGGLLTPLFSGLDVFDRAGTGIVVMNDFVLPRRSTEGVNAFRSKGTFAHTVAHANKHLRLRLSLRDHTFLFPLADVVAQVGRDHAFNWRTHYRGHVTWSDRLMAAVAERYVGFALAATGRATKCIVLDLDNTLWGGVLGEEGPAGIALGPQWPGSEFVDFQRELLDLQGQGILLALCSKNNEHEALAVLREHSSMLIREAHLAAYRINWDDKATNIRDIARELNIGLDHMLLIDDSPHERAGATGDSRAAGPRAPVRSDDVRDWVAHSRRSSCSSRRWRTPSAPGSTRSLAAARPTAARWARWKPFSGDWGCGRTSAARRRQCGPGGATPRQDQPVNLTTRRHDESTIRRRTASGEWRVYTMGVTDRFGDFGLTGVAIVVPGEGTWQLESFLMSCRVIGKSVETALLARIAEDAREAGATALAAEFIDSGRNQVAAGFLPGHGFAAGPGEDGHADSRPEARNGRPGSKRRRP